MEDQMSTEEGAPDITSSIVSPSSSSSVSTSRIIMEGGGISPENVIHVINPSSLGSLSSVVNAVSSTAAGGMSGLHTITIAPGSFPIPVNFASNLQVMCLGVLCAITYLSIALKAYGISGQEEVCIINYALCCKKNG